MYCVDILGQINRLVYNSLYNTVFVSVREIVLDLSFVSIPNEHKTNDCGFSCIKIEEEE